MIAPLPHCQPSMAHTPAPWRVTRDERGSIIRAIDDTGRPIASMWLNGDDAEANAALIVEAVNSHASLRARVEELEARERWFIEDMAASVHEVKATDRQREIFKASLRFAISHARRLASARAALNTGESE